MDENDTCIICYNTIDEKNLCKTNCNHIYCLIEEILIVQCVV